MKFKEAKEEFLAKMISIEIFGMRLENIRMIKGNFEMYLKIVNWCCFRLL